MGKKSEKTAPRSYLNKRRPPLSEAIAAEGDVPGDKALELLIKKGYFTANPRPWRVGAQDRGLGHYSWAVLDKFGAVIAVTSKVNAELIVTAVNLLAKKK